MTRELSELEKFLYEQGLWMKKQFELVESTLETWPEAKQDWAKDRKNDE